MQTDPSPIRKASSSPQASVGQRAAALLKLLGAEGTEAPCASSRGVQPAAVADLMGGLDDSAPTAAGPDLMGAPSATYLPFHQL